MSKRAIREALGLVTGEKPKAPRTNYKQRADDALTMGFHPATGRPLRRELGTCGDCAHHIVRGHRSRAYHKCERHKLGVSSSEASDIRVGWPACADFALCESGDIINAAKVTSDRPAVTTDVQGTDG